MSLKLTIQRKWNAWKQTLRDYSKTEKIRIIIFVILGSIFTVTLFLEFPDVFIIRFFFGLATLLGFIFVVGAMNQEQDKKARQTMEQSEEVHALVCQMLSMKLDREIHNKLRKIQALSSKITMGVKKHLIHKKNYDQ